MANKSKADKSKAELLLLSSEDDDDDDVGGTSGFEISSEVRETLREAREARQKLRAAQDANKGANDSVIDVSDDSSIGDSSNDDAGPKGGRGGNDDDSDDDVVLVGGAAASTGAAAAAAAAASNTASLGPVIQITLRANALKKQFMKKIRMMDQLKKIILPIRKALGVQPDCKIELQFDGQAMNLEKTPAFYDMEDEDMVDIVVK